jgi:plastocyanin
MRLNPPRILVLGLAAVTATLTAGAQAVPAAAGGGGCHTTPYSDAPADNVDIKELCFHPNVVRIANGTTLTFRNVDGMDHTVTGVSDSFGSMEVLSSGKSVSYKFQKDGVFPYFCLYHPGMVGAVVVGTGSRSPGSPSGLITPVKPAAARVITTPPTAAGIPTLPLVLAALALLAAGFLGGRRVASR